MALLGSYELAMNRGLLFVGSSVEPDFDLVVGAGGLEKVVTASTNDVMVRTRSQAGPVRVRLWRDNCPVDGAIVFEGPLMLATGNVHIYDFDALDLVRHRLGGPGDYRFTIRVDDPGSAARVDVTLDEGPGRSALHAVAGRALGAVAAVEGEELQPTSELGLILAGHDVPLNRLAAAIKVIIIDNGVNRYLIRQVVEWLRLVHPLARELGCRQLGDQLMIDISNYLLSNGKLDDVDERSLDLAARVLTELGAI